MDNKTQHTPGINTPKDPGKIWHSFETGGVHVIRCIDLPTARVAMASQELLEAAKQALSSILTAEELDGLDPDMFTELKAALRAAIAKATGEV